MGKSSREQIDEGIAWGIANRWSEQRILDQRATLERMTDEELAAEGVFPTPPKDSKSVTLVLALPRCRRVTLARPSAQGAAPAPSLPDAH